MLTRDDGKRAVVFGDDELVYQKGGPPQIMRPGFPWPQPIKWNYLGCVGRKLFFGEADLLAIDPNPCIVRGID